MKIMKTLENMKVDKKLFGAVFLYSMLFFIAMFAIMLLFSGILGNLAAKIETIAQTAEQMAGAGSMLLTMLIVMSIFIILELLNYAFFENLIWNTIFGRKTTFRNTMKFLGLAAILLAVFLGVLIGASLLISSLPEKIAGAAYILVYLIAFFGFYLLYVSYMSFGKTHKVFYSVKNAYLIGIKRLDLAIFPIIIATIIGILLNLALWPASLLPETINYIAQGIIFSAYMSWIKLYYTNAMKPALKSIRV